MAIHNLSEDKLKGILELGGFPVPSIAITNPNFKKITKEKNFSNSYSNESLQSFLNNL